MAPAFDDAVTAARSAPNLSVGCHVVLVDGTPVSPPGALDTLVAIRSAEPDKFYSSLSAFAARAMLGGFDRDQLVAEVTAQIRKIQATGLQVTHLDTHKHAHIFPEILTALLRAARMCGVRAIRNPIVPVKALPARPIQGQAASLEALRPGTRSAYFFRAIPPADQARRTGYARRRAGSDRDRLAWHFPAAPDAREPAGGNMGVGLPSRL